MNTGKLQLILSLSLSLIQQQSGDYCLLDKDEEAEK